MDVDEEPFVVDSRFQFDAPMCRDIGSAHPFGHGDDWFRRHHESPVSLRDTATGFEEAAGDETDIGERVPADKDLLENKGIDSANVPLVVRRAPAPPQEVPSNIVTSWDHIPSISKPQNSETGRPLATTKHQGPKRVARQPLQCVSQPPRKAPRLGSTATRRAQLTTEEMQFREAQEGAAQAAALRKKNASKVKAVLSTRAAASCRSTKPLTVPEEFSLRTEDRLRLHKMTTRSMTDTRGRWRSLAQMVADFDKTPDRFKPLPPGQKLPILPPKMQLTLTVPQGPRLRTAARCKATRCKEQKQEEVAEGPCDEDSRRPRRIAVRRPVTAMNPGKDKSLYK